MNMISAPSTLKRSRVQQHFSWQPNASAMVLFSLRIIFFYNLDWIIWSHTKDISGTTFATSLSVALVLLQCWEKIKKTPQQTLSCKPGQQGSQVFLGLDNVCVSCQMAFTSLVFLCSMKISVDFEWKQEDLERH